MMTSARRLGLASLVPLLAVLALLGCGGGGGSSSSECTQLCNQFAACSVTLDTTVGALIDDDTVTAGNCPSKCDDNTSDCADKSGFFSCVGDLVCSSVDDVRIGLFSCIGAYCEAT